MQNVQFRFEKYECYCIYAKDIFNSIHVCAFVFCVVLRTMRKTYGCRTIVLGVSVIRALYFEFSLELFEANYNCEFIVFCTYFWNCANFWEQEDFQIFWFAIIEPTHFNTNFVYYGIMIGGLENCLLECCTMFCSQPLL